MLDPQRLGEGLIPVFRTSDETAAAVARSICKEAGISCTVKGEFMSDVTGMHHPCALYAPRWRQCPRLTRGPSDIWMKDKQES